MIDESGASWRRSSLLASLSLDCPWDAENSRHAVLLVSLLSGLLAGGLEGAAICQANPELAGPGGDATFWDTVASGAWMGAGAGVACGLAVAASRNFWMRCSLAALLGILFVPAALILSSAGAPQGRWEGEGLRAGRTLLEQPMGWGVYFGTGFAGTMAAVVHLTRSCLQRPRRLGVALLLGAVLGARSQSFFWREWIRLGRRDPSCAFSGFESPGIPGGVICAMTTAAVLLIAHRLTPRAASRRLPMLLGSLIALLSLSLVGAVRAMPFTQPSEIVDLAFTGDGDQVITAHAGNTIRLWDFVEDPRGNALPPKELGCWRFTKRRAWHAPLILRPPFAAALLPGAVQLWKLPQMRELGTVPLGDDDWSELALSPDAGFLAVSRRTELRLFRLERDADHRQLRILEEPPPKAHVREPAGRLARRALAVSDSGECSFTTRARAHPLGPLDIRKSSCYGVLNISTLADGTEILAANGIECSYLWNSGRVGGLMTFCPPMGSFDWAVLSSDERLLALVGSQDRWIIDLERGRPRVHDFRFREVPQLLASSPDGDRIVEVVRGRINAWKWPSPDSVP